MRNARRSLSPVMMMMNENEERPIIKMKDSERPIVKMKKNWVHEDFDEWSELTKERDGTRAADTVRPRTSSGASFGRQRPLDQGSARDRVLLQIS